MSGWGAGCPEGGEPPGHIRTCSLIPEQEEAISFEPLEGDPLGGAVSICGSERALKPQRFRQAGEHGATCLEWHLGKRGQWQEAERGQSHLRSATNQACMKREGVELPSGAVNREWTSGLVRQLVSSPPPNPKVCARPPHVTLTVSKLSAQSQGRSALSATLRPRGFQTPVCI